MADFKEELKKLRECLSDVQFLEHLKLPELDKLLAVMKKQRFRANQVIITQGEKGDAFYMIGEGKCSVWQKKSGVSLAKLASLKMDEAFGNMEKVATLYPGSFFGEGALVTSKPRSATVKAETDVELYILHRDAFNQTLMANPGIAGKIRARAAQLAYSNR
jgi:putative ABC transport system ATP-binding protein